MWMWLGPKISKEFNKYVGKPLDKKKFEDTAKKQVLKNLECVKMIKDVGFITRTGLLQLWIRKKIK